MRPKGSISIDELAAMSGQTPVEWEAGYDAASKATDSPSIRCAQVVPFPIQRRQRWIDAQIKRAATFPRREGAWLRGLVEKYRCHLTEIGVDAAIIEREVRNLEQVFFGGEQRGAGLTASTDAGASKKGHEEEDGR